jgi:hypothetical protein
MSTTDISEKKGLETLIMQHMTGVDALTPVAEGVHRGSAASLRQDARLGLKLWILKIRLRRQGEKARPA